MRTRGVKVVTITIHLDLEVQESPVAETLVSALTTNSSMT